ncbi:MAG: hypothetical protein N2486_08450 [Caloramator sp.]|nr:hypothetical protein [Caloramator sp.]
MLKFHRIDDIEKFVSGTLLEDYKKNYTNLLLASIMAGIHRTFGLRHEGIIMAMEIVDTITDDTTNLIERNLLVWNLYVLANEFIDEGYFERAMNFIERAEKNWTRDILLGDEMGVYHVSWIEQFWLLKSRIYMHLKDDKNFQKTTDMILDSRLKLFKEAENKTGETIVFDRCTYNTFEIMAMESRRKNILSAINFLKQAILIKGNIKIDSDYKNVNPNPYKYYDSLMNYFNGLQEKPYDNIKYLYCASCKFFDGEGICKRHGTTTDKFKACSMYE